MVPPDFVTPLILAAVFTLGGYAILGVRESADAVGALLFCVFVICALMAMSMLAVQLAEHVPSDAAQVVRARAR